jgi:probable HAF family extracellular repeat protein
VDLARLWRYPTQRRFRATYAEGINNSGEVVGFYVDSGGIDHAFLYNHNSATHWITLDDPNASQNFDVGTYAEGINNSGEIVGYYVDSGGAPRAVDVCRTVPARDLVDRSKNAARRG